MTSGRPVLTIPFAGDFPSVTDHILVAWNASREATRAVHDALPLLLNAKQVTILAVNPRAPAGDSDEPHTDAIDVEPFDASTSETTRNVYGHSCASGMTGKSARSANAP